MPDFDFKRCTRKCASSDREIAAGESYYSALIEGNDGIERKDYCEEQWPGPPEGCVGWWQSRIPVLEKGKIYWAPSRVLLAYFESVSERPELKQTAYVMALLLVRKRILQWKDTIQRGEIEFMALRHAGEKKSFEIETVKLSPEQISTIQNELAEQLFSDQAEDQSNATMSEEESL